MIKIKICGFTKRRDIEDSIKLGIDIVGINFYKKSPRFISVQSAKSLLADLPLGIIKIGLFVNPDEKKLYETTRLLKLSGVQFHGNEPPSMISKFKKQFPDKIVIKAVRVKDKETIINALKIFKPDFFLFDTYDEAFYGGTGKSINSGLLKGIKIDWGKVFLAGGINPDNVRERIKHIRPYGLDIASGVELAPGIKDMGKISRLLRTLKDDAL